jgi:Holliday junction DNA helicase RuvA
MMIRELKGEVLRKEVAGLTVNVGGWGVFIAMPSTEAFSEGDLVHLMTYLAVKQDGIDLYGFSSEEDRRFFELSLSVSGVGPKTALSLLRRAPRESLEKAIAARDISYLTRVVGLGKKSAEKLVVEISEKLSGTGESVSGDDAEVFDTLVALGYTEREARGAVNAIPSSITGKDARLKAALSSGGK